MPPPAKPAALEVVEAVERGQLQPEQAWVRYGITPEAIEMWHRAREQVGVLKAGSLH